MLSFASVEDVEARWRPLDSSERLVAEVLLDDASDIIRVRWSDIDSRVDSGAVSEQTVIRVTAGMVRRAMMNRNAEGITQMQETTGPFSNGATYTNPNNNLYLSADDIRALDADGYSPRVKVGWLA